jgi:nucleoporin GLE1
VQPVQPFPVPKVFLYMVNYTCKVIVRQMSVDCIDAGFAEPLGVCTATMFAQPDFKPQGHSMADMFLAKFHRSLPPLFGIFHDELTVEGRNKLGFRTDAHGSRENWVSNAKGLARGYAAVTLRDFSRSKNQNPFPNRLYWESIARISTTPQPQQLMLHFAILDGLLDPHFIPRFIRCYGGYALAALRLAIIDFPTTRDRRKKSHEEQAKQLGNMLAKYEDVLQLRL